MMLTLDAEQTAARTWFESLRNRICAEFESIEREAGSDAAFDYIAWDRTDPSGAPGGGGVRGVMKGKVFEKVGVNVSTVGLESSPVADALAGLRANEARYFKNKYDHVFTVEPAAKAKKAVAKVAKSKTAKSKAAKAAKPAKKAAKKAVKAAAKKAKAAGRKASAGRKPAKAGKGTKAKTARGNARKTVKAAARGRSSAARKTAKKASKQRVKAAKRLTKRG